MYIEDMLWSFDRGVEFDQFTIKEKKNTYFVQNSNFMRMRSNLRMKGTKLQTINISSATFYYSTANMTPSLKSNCMEAL